MENKNKNLWVGLAVVVILVGGIMWYMDRGGNGGQPATEDVDSVEDVSEGSVNANIPASSIAYKDALVKYKDARIQLDAACQASPNSLTFKNGTNIMIDNRAPVSRSVKVGSVFTIKAYGFKIVNLSSATLPTTWYVDCDKSQNVSTISIQQ